MPDVENIINNLEEELLVCLNYDFELQWVDSDVEGYPTIRLVGKKKKDYNGKREVKDLAKFIKKSLGKCRKTSKKNAKEKKEG